MKYDLKFEIHGVSAGGDDAVFETELSALTTELLMPIMGWQTEEDAMSSYLLTPDQANTIENLAAISLPKDSELYLSCYSDDAAHQLPSQ